MSWTDPEETMFESWLSRGDRHMGSLIYSAWQHGAKFDAWQDQFNLSAWQQAFQETGMNPDFYNHRQRNMDEIFPWDHIGVGVSKKFFLREYQKSQNGQLTEDCSKLCSACGILSAYDQPRDNTTGNLWKCPPQKETA